MTDIHPTAVVDGGARIGANVTVGPYSIVGAGVELADDVQASIQGSFDFAVSESGTMIYSTGAGGSVLGEGLVWVDRDEQVSEIDPRISSELQDIDNLALSPDGRFIALEGQEFEYGRVIHTFTHMLTFCIRR